MFNGYREFFELFKPGEEAHKLNGMHYGALDPVTNLEQGLDEPALARLHEISGWMKGKTEYDMAMKHVLDEFYNMGVAAYKITARKYEDYEPMDLFQNIDAETFSGFMQKQSMMPDGKSAKEWLQSDVVTEHIGHKMTDDEVCAWAVDTAAAMKNYLVPKDAGIDCGALREKLRTNAGQAAPSQDMQDAMQEVQEAIEEGRGMPDEYFDAAAPSDDQDSAPYDDSRRKKRDEARKAEEAAAAEHEAEERSGRGRSGAAAAAGTAAGAAYSEHSHANALNDSADGDAHGSDAAGAGEQAAQTDMSLYGLPPETQKQFRIVKAVMTMTRDDSFLYADMRRSSEYLLGKDRQTRRGRKLAAQMRSTIEDHERIKNRAMQLNNALVQSMNMQAEAELRSKGIYVPHDSSTSFLDRTRQKIAKRAAEQRSDVSDPGGPRPGGFDAGGGNTDPVQGVSADTVQRRRKPLGAKAFLAAPPVLFIGNVVGKIRSKLSSAIEKNQPSPEHDGPERSVDDRDDNMDLFTDIMDAEPDETPPARNSRFRAFWQNVAQPVKDRMPKHGAKQAESETETVEAENNGGTSAGEYDEEYAPIPEDLYDGYDDLSAAADMLAEMYDGDPEEYDETGDVSQESGPGQPENGGKTEQTGGSGSADEYDEQDDPPGDNSDEKEDQKDEQPGMSGSAGEYDEYDESDEESAGQAGQEAPGDTGAGQAAAGSGRDGSIPGRDDAGSEAGPGTDSDRYDTSDLYQQAAEKAKALAEHGAAQAAAAESAGKDIDGITGDILARNGQTIASISQELAENTVKGAGQTPGDTTQRLFVEVSRLKGGQDDVEKILGS